MCKMYQMPNIWHIWHTKHQKTPFIRCSKSHKICHIWTIPLHFAMVWTKNGISFNVFLFSLLSPLSSVYSFLFSLTSVFSHRFPLSYKLLILIHQSITIMATTGNKNINADLSDPADCHHHRRSLRSSLLIYPVIVMATMSHCHRRSL